MRGGGVALGRYLEGCGGTSLGEVVPSGDVGGDGLGDYLSGSGGGLVFSRVEHGRVTERRAASSEDLASLMAGDDPFSGVHMRAVRHGQIGCFDIPLNDCKQLDVLGVVYGDVRQAHREAQRHGVEAVKEYLGRNLMARRQDGGRTRFVPADSLLFVEAEHATSREGDPHTHTHLELMNVCLADGKWVAVTTDRRFGGLFGMYENIRSVYETTVYGDPGLRAALARHGASIALDGTVPEIGDAADVFSKRRDRINERLGELVEQWRVNHAAGMEPVIDADTGRTVGHVGYEGCEEPDERTLMRLRVQAWADTRKGKGEWNTREDADAWRRELEAEGYDIPGMLAGRTCPVYPSADDVSDEDVSLCALDAVAALGESRSAWSLNDVEVACYDQVRGLNVTGDREQLERLAGRIVGEAVRLCEPLSDDGRAALPFMPSLTSGAVVECERDLKGRLLARGMDDGGRMPDVEDLAVRFSLDGGQREAVEAICRYDPLAVVEGAAGAGKTHMLAAVKDFCDGTGMRLTIATPTRKAALAAADEVGVRADTVMRLLEAYGWRHDETRPALGWRRLSPGERDHRGNVYRGVPEGMALGEDSVLVVDEAGMLDQGQARALLHVADETGARLVLVGDRSQLSAVGRGGVLDMAEACTSNVVVMENVHRFEDPDYAAFTVRLRDHGETTADALADEIVSRGMVSRHGSDEETEEAIARAWLDQPHVTVSTSTNGQADRVNAAVQRARIHAGQLGEESCACMTAGQRVHVGDRIMCRRNDRAAGVSNRETLTVTAVGPDGLTAVGADRRTVRLGAGYVRAAVQLGYASTVYGAQGVTDRAGIFYAAPGATGADAYVALTRGKASNRVYMTAADDGEARSVLAGILARDRADRGLDAARRDLKAMTGRVADSGRKAAPVSWDGSRARALEVMDRWAADEERTLSEAFARVSRDLDDVERKLADVRRRLESKGQERAKAEHAASKAERDWKELDDRTTERVERIRDKRNDIADVLLDDLAKDLGRCRPFHESMAAADRRLRELDRRLLPSPYARRRAEQERERAARALDAFRDRWGEPWENLATARDTQKAMRECVDRLPSIARMDTAIDRIRNARWDDPAYGRLNRARTSLQWIVEDERELSQKEDELRKRLDGLPTHDVLQEVGTRLDALRRMRTTENAPERYRTACGLYHDSLASEYRKELARWRKDPRTGDMRELADRMRRTPDAAGWLWPVPDASHHRAADLAAGTAERWTAVSDMTVRDALRRTVPPILDDERLKDLDPVQIREAIDRTRTAITFQDAWADAILEGYRRGWLDTSSPASPDRYAARLCALYRRDIAQQERDIAQADMLRMPMPGIGMHYPSSGDHVAGPSL